MGLKRGDELVVTEEFKRSPYFHWNFGSARENTLYFVYESQQDASALVSLLPPGNQKATPYTHCVPLDFVRRMRERYLSNQEHI